jgi:uncharacterized protein (TIGR02186 family)
LGLALRGALGSVLLTAILPVAARAESVLIDLSTSRVEIHSGFTGAFVTVFGVIERDQRTVSRVGGYEVVLTIAGPRQAVLVQRKERIAGIWVNRASHTFTDVPSFFAIYSTNPVADIVYAPIARTLQLDLDYVGHGGVVRGVVERREPFRAALAELKRLEGLYEEVPGAIEMIRPDVFKARFYLPASVDDGEFLVSAHLFADGTHLASTTQPLDVVKTGFEETVYELSVNRPFLYGLLVVLMALATGYLGSILFRRN